MLRIKLILKVSLNLFLILKIILQVFAKQQIVSHS